jgi:hypothetical protein
MKDRLNIGEVRQTFDQETCNDLLADGWHLLTTHTRKFPDGCERTYFTLGLPRPEPIKPQIQDHA